MYVDYRSAIRRDNIHSNREGEEEEVISFALFR